uniref:mitogen-activated protein kinase kinase n=1 Tax=Chlamydomonas euryale TaxID=1486919 RepID=A0A7R9YQF3_9CHLO|mmetsp:Transcript_13252/g.38507  ORF Transcript_13252/g.38507 Transcript_13252/m.38507 type:complete len:762 (+) Transcript_13252:745-3030(+)
MATELATKAYPGPHGFFTKLCYYFTFFSKCPYWQECDYLHVIPSEIYALCKRYKCQVGRMNSPCGYRKCPYAHRIDELRIPHELREPAYPNQVSAAPYKRLILLKPDGSSNQCEFTISTKYIANTPGSLSLHMCHNRWCTVTEQAACRSVHLLPAAWAEDAFQDVRGSAPEAPKYFLKQIDALKKQAAEAVTSATSLNRPSTSRNSWIGNHVSDNLSCRPGTSLVNPDDFPSLNESAGSPLCIVVPNPELETSVHLPPESEATQEAVDFLELLNLPPYKEFIPSNLPVHKDYEDIVTKWDSGVSSCFNNYYTGWLESGQMTPSWECGGVLTHANMNSLIGSGFAANVLLGITVADGREVALKIFREKSAVDQKTERKIQQHFAMETKSLKLHCTVPGIVQFLGSFQKTEHDPNQGLNLIYNVVILELMEGTLKEAVQSWDKSEVLGRPAQLLLVRYVLGSMLHVLGQLNHSELQCLVHRDVKPDNIMIDRNKNIRLIDFGISKVIDKAKQYATVSFFDGTRNYTSPEASESAKAHITSDLYSLGMVMRFLMTGQDPSGPLKPNDIPNWPPHHREAAQHLVTQLTLENPNERALNSVAKFAQLPHHRILMAHPFFWTSRQGISFLVDLGNLLSPPVPGLGGIVRGCYDPSTGWFPVVQHFESSDPRFKTPEADKASPWGLMRFVRNRYVHSTDIGLEYASDNQLLAGPVVLELFPRLVLECWKHMVPDARRISRELPNLAGYFRNGWDTEAARNPDEETAWL